MNQTDINRTYTCTGSVGQIATEVAEAVIDDSLTRFRVPFGFGKFTGKLLLPLLFIEHDIISIINNSGDKGMNRIFQEMVQACSYMYGQSVCPICHQARVTHFIIPDLNIYSPCFRYTCCGESECKQNLLQSYALKEFRLAKIGLEAVVNEESYYDRRTIAKFVRDICGLPRKYESAGSEDYFVRKLSLALNGDMDIAFP